MLDRDLAELYGVETKVLNQAVKRNAGRFPGDFMFQLTTIEFENLKSQFVTSSWLGIRKLPYAFTGYRGTGCRYPCTCHTEIILISEETKIKGRLQKRNRLCQKQTKH